MSEEKTPVARDPHLAGRRVCLESVAWLATCVLVTPTIAQVFSWNDDFK